MNPIAYTSLHGKFINDELFVPGTNKEEPTIGSWTTLPDLPNATPANVSIGDDGMVWCLDINGNAYSFVNDQWQQIQAVTNAVQVYVGNAKHVYIRDNTNTVTCYYFTEGEWNNIQFDGQCNYIAGSADGTVWALNTSNQLTLYLASTPWSPTQIVADTVTVGNYNEVWATIDESVFQIINGYPYEIDGTLKKISVGSDGKLWGINDTGAVFERVKSGIYSYFDAWVTKDDAPTLIDISVGSRFLVVGIGADNNLYLFQPDSLTPVLNPQNFDELIMCANFASWAYLLLPSETDWWGTSSKQFTDEFENSAWKIYNTYDDKYTSTEGFLAHAPYNNTNDTTIVLTIRGSQEVWDFYKDVTAYGWLENPPGESYKVSFWVYTAWQAIKGDVSNDLANLLSSTGLGAIDNIYIVGHSLGAAIACYAAYDLYTSGVFGSLASTKIRMVNFASPPVGDFAFASLYSGTGITSYRVIDPTDEILWASGWLTYLEGTWANVGQLVPLPSYKGHSITYYIDNLNKMRMNNNSQLLRRWKTIHLKK